MSVCVHAKSFWSCPTLGDPWTVARQAPLSMGFSRQEYWSGLPCHPPGDLLDPGIAPRSLISPTLSGRFFTSRWTWDLETLSFSPSTSHTHICDYVLCWFSIYTSHSKQSHKTFPDIFVITL